ncbi:MAG: hypothetical protein ACREOQ_06155 [Gemmatimonadales bacterium]
MHGRWRLLLCALLVTSSACSHSAGSQPGPNMGSVKVEVTNQNALPMEIYAFGSGISHRLGTVHPGMDGHFVVPPTLVGNGSVVFEARPTGGGRPFRSGEILLAPDALIEFQIASQLFNSTVVRH